MKRQPPPAYGDGNMNPYGGGGQRMRGNTGAMSNSYGGGRQDGYSSVEAEQHPGYKSSKAEGNIMPEPDITSDLIAARLDTSVKTKRVQF